MSLSDGDVRPSFGSSRMQNPVARQPAQVLCFLLSRLELTLIRHLANVDSKRLTEKLSSLQSALTKYRGGEGMLRFFHAGRSDLRMSPRVFHLSLLFSSNCTLFCAPGAMQLFWNQFVAHSFRYHGGVGGLLSLSATCLSSVVRSVPRHRLRTDH